MTSLRDIAPPTRPTAGLGYGRDPELDPGGVRFRRPTALVLVSLTVDVGLRRSPTRRGARRFATEPEAAKKAFGRVYVGWGSAESGDRVPQRRETRVRPCSTEGAE